MENPFNFLQLASGDQFYDRAELRKDLLSRFLSGPSSVVLYGPRRYGKSSLVSELAKDLEKAGMPCVMLDMVKVPSIDLFVSSYATKVYRKLAPVKFELKKMGEFIKSLRPKISIDPEGNAGFTFDAASGDIGPEALTEVLDLPQRLLSGKRRAVVILDEFQEVEGLMPDDGFERVMRSAIQGHRNVSYIFLGSRYHILRRMFTERSRPFYKSAVTILLEKPPVDESISFVMDRFGESQGPTDSLGLLVYADDRLICDTGLINGDMSPRQLHLNVSGAKTLKIQAYVGADCSSYSRIYVVNGSVSK